MPKENISKRDLVLYLINKFYSAAIIDIAKFFSSKLDNSSKAWEHLVNHMVNDGLLTKKLDENINKLVVTATKNDEPQKFDRASLVQIINSCIEKSGGINKDALLSEDRLDDFFSDFENISSLHKKLKSTETNNASSEKNLKFLKYYYVILKELKNCKEITVNDLRNKLENTFGMVYKVWGDYINILKKHGYLSISIQFYGKNSGDNLVKIEKKGLAVLDEVGQERLEKIYDELLENRKSMMTYTNNPAVISILRKLHESSHGLPKKDLMHSIEKYENHDLNYYFQRLLNCGYIKSKDGKSTNYIISPEFSKEVDKILDDDTSTTTTTLAPLSQSHPLYERWQEENLFGDYATAMQQNSQRSDSGIIDIPDLINIPMSSAMEITDNHDFVVLQNPYQNYSMETNVKTSSEQTGEGEINQSFDMQEKNVSSELSNAEQPYFPLNDHAAIEKFEKLAGIKYLKSNLDKEDSLALTTIDILTQNGEKQWHVVALKKINKGKIIGEYTGEIIPKKDSDQSSMHRMAIGQNKVIDAKKKGNFTSKLNSSDTPNVIFEISENGKKMLVKATREIKEYQPVYAAYGDDFTIPNKIFLNRFHDWRSTEQFKMQYEQHYEKFIYFNAMLDKIHGKKGIFFRYYYLTSLTKAVLFDDESLFQMSLQEKQALDLPVLANETQAQQKLLPSWQQEFTTALMVACCLGKPAYVRQLMLAGADPNIQQPFSGKTALHLVVESNLDAKIKVEIIDIFLQHSSVNFLAKDINGNTALHLAIEKREIECVKKILDKKVNFFSCRNNDDYNPVIYAVMFGEEEIIRAMLRKIQRSLLVNFVTNPLFEQTLLKLSFEKRSSIEEIFSEFSISIGASSVSNFLDGHQKAFSNESRKAKKRTRDEFEKDEGHAQTDSEDEIDSDQTMLEFNSQS